MDENNNVVIFKVDVIRPNMNQFEQQSVELIPKTNLYVEVPVKEEWLAGFHEGKQNEITLTVKGLGKVFGKLTKGF